LGGQTIAFGEFRRPVLHFALGDSACRAEHRQVARGEDYASERQRPVAGANLHSGDRARLATVWPPALARQQAPRRGELALNRNSRAPERAKAGGIAFGKGDLGKMPIRQAQNAKIGIIKNA
jgi:hypothetical protein